MKASERLKKIENKLPYILTYRDGMKKEIKWLINRVERLTEALEKIDGMFSQGSYEGDVARKALEEDENNS